MFPRAKDKCLGLTTIVFRVRTSIFRVNTQFFSLGTSVLALSKLVLRTQCFLTGQDKCFYG